MFDRIQLRPGFPGVELRLGARNDHVWIALQYRLDADLRGREFEVGKHVTRSAHGQRIADDLPAAQGVERLIPHLVKHPQRRVTVVAGAQLGQTGAQLISQFLTAFRVPQSDGKGWDLLNQLIKGLRVGGLGRDVEAVQLLALGNAHAARPEQNQVGLQAE